MKDWHWHRLVAHQAVAAPGPAHYEASDWKVRKEVQKGSHAPTSGTAIAAGEARGQKHLVGAADGVRCSNYVEASAMEVLRAHDMAVHTLWGAVEEGLVSCAAKAAGCRTMGQTRFVVPCPQVAAVSTTREVAAALRCAWEAGRWLNGGPVASGDLGASRDASRNGCFVRTAEALEMRVS